MACKKQICPGCKQELMCSNLQAYVHTKRENEVVELMMNGYRTKEIAIKLHIMPRTVKAYLEHLYRKHNIIAGAKAVKLVATLYRERLCQQELDSQKDQRIFH